MADKGLQAASNAPLLGSGGSVGAGNTLSAGTRFSALSSDPLGGLFGSGDGLGGTLSAANGNGMGGLGGNMFDDMLKAFGDPKVEATPLRLPHDSCACMRRHGQLEQPALCPRSSHWATSRLCARARTRSHACVDNAQDPRARAGSPFCPAASRFARASSPRLHCLDYCDELQLHCPSPSALIPFTRTDSHRIVNIPPPQDWAKGADWVKAKGSVRAQPFGQGKGFQAAHIRDLCRTVGVCGLMGGVFQT